MANHGKVLDNSNKVVHHTCIHILPPSGLIQFARVSQLIMKNFNVQDNKLAQIKTKTKVICLSGSCVEGWSWSEETVSSSVPGKWLVQDCLLASLIGQDVHKVNVLIDLIIILDRLCNYIGILLPHHCIIYILLLIRNSTIPSPYRYHPGSDLQVLRREDRGTLSSWIPF